MREYKEHLRAVSLDRELEQHFQGLNPINSDRPVMFLQIDGMDQSKWALPRYPGNRVSKEFSKYIRPRVKLVGCWISGYLLSLNVVDANFAHDASLTVEVFEHILSFKLVGVPHLSNNCSEVCCW